MVASESGEEEKGLVKVAGRRLSRRPVVVCIEGGRELGEKAGAELSDGASVDSACQSSTIFDLSRTGPEKFASTEEMVARSRSVGREVETCRTRPDTACNSCALASSQDRGPSHQT